MNKPLRLWGLTGLQIILFGAVIVMFFAFINFWAFLIIPLLAIPCKKIMKADRLGHPDYTSSWRIEQNTKRRFMDKHNLLAKLIA